MNHTFEQSHLIRVLPRVSRLVLLSALIMGITLACAGNAPASENPASHVSNTTPTVPSPVPTAGLDFSKSRLSENGLFRVSYVSSDDSIPVNQIHQWTLHVETANGQVVENAAITVEGDMPEHGHGLPTRPQVTQYLGNGDYLVEGVKFQMAGWWVMDFTITADNLTDAVRFNMSLE